MPPELSHDDIPLAEAIRSAATPIVDIDTDDTSHILDDIGDARIVLLGEATHGTSEFYRMRARLTRELIERKGFRLVAIEADWPDAARIDEHVRDRGAGAHDWRAFDRFPTWMWRNQEFAQFVTTLRELNASRDNEDKVGFHGLDLYSMGTSIRAVLRYLDDIDPGSARVARQRYACLSPWENDPAEYGRAAVTKRHRDCEDDAIAMLQDLLAHRVEAIGAGPDGDRFLDAVQNARVVQSAERYYRFMYRGDRSSWNLRDTHMADTLDILLDHYGPGSKAVVWAHNSHLGDARFTEMATHGEHNLGQLTKDRHGKDVYALGFGTDHGTVAAAHDWGGQMHVMDIVPSHPRSHERLMHESKLRAFFLPLSDPRLSGLRQPRLERAIGVIYRPDTELQSHYFRAELTRQFDGYVWFDRTHAVSPLPIRETGNGPHVDPFGP